MNKVILTKGLPGSGKSHWAKAMIKAQPNLYVRIEKDCIREMLFGGEIAWNPKFENLVIKTRNALILEAIVSLMLL